MATYYIEIDGGQGGHTYHEADNIEDAVDYARDWTRDGAWDTSQGTVYCDVRVTVERSSIEAAQVAIDTWESADADEIADVYAAIYERQPHADDDAVSLIHASCDMLTEEAAARVLALLGTPDVEERDITVSIEPEAPHCLADEHDWQSPHSVLGGSEENPGVWLHGGGAIIRECCAHCGWYRVTDTWAQRRDTGAQGLTDVRYEAPDEASMEWVSS